jgi:mono/diheme cytochrome c family protein
LRNGQGLIDAPNGHLYASEHGDAIEDEINLIKPKGNYGWDVIEGMHDQDYENAYAKQHNAIEPLYSWTPTIAPAGLDYYNSDKIPEWENSLLLTTLKGKSLRVLKLNEQGDKVVDEKIYLENVYGRIRDICISPEGDIYISTSNRDWNPMIEPTAIDDRILRIARVEKAEKVPLKAKDMELEKLSHQTGEVLYQKYCLACHKLNGKGLEGTFPSLAGSKIVANAKDFIPFVLKGSDKGMPSFKFLNDEELSKILNYVGGAWGNKTDSISEDEVEGFR